MGLLNVRVTPRSSRNKVEVDGEAVKVWVTASPTDGQANEAVCRALAQALEIAKTRVMVKRGHTSRDKQVEILDLERDEILRRLTL